MCVVLQDQKGGTFQPLPDMNQLLKLEFSACILKQEITRQASVLEWRKIKFNLIFEQAHLQQHDLTTWKAWTKTSWDLCGCKSRMCCITVHHFAKHNTCCCVSDLRMHISRRSGRQLFFQVGFAQYKSQTTDWRFKVERLHHSDCRVCIRF